MAGTTRLELATSAVTVDIKRCRRTSFDTPRYRMSLLIVPLLYPDFGGVTEFLTPHFRITFGLPTTRNVAGPLNTSALEQY